MNKILKINFKKTSLRFITAAVIAVVLCGIVNVFNFAGRVPTWRSQINTIKSEYKASQNVNVSSDSQNYRKHDHEKYKHGEDSDYNDEIEQKIKSVISLTTMDKAIIGVTGVIGVVLGAIYWILVVLWMTKRAYLDGANIVIVGIAALLFNIAAVAAYYIYRSLVNRCPSCGKIQKRNAEFCSYCGHNIVKTCSKCGAKIKFTDKFCNKCGNKQE